MLRKLVTLAFLTLMAAVGLAVPVMVPGSADHASKSIVTESMALTDRWTLQKALT